MELPKCKNAKSRNSAHQTILGGKIISTQKKIKEKKDCACEFLIVFSDNIVNKMKNGEGEREIRNFYISAYIQTFRKRINFPKIIIYEIFL